MLIATLPTLTGPETEKLSEKIIGHPLIGAVRYNTGGDSPFEPKRILEILKPIADRHKKILYVDLEGRQVRVARWSPQSKGVAVLNRDFAIELPASIHFRGTGWFEVVNARPEKRKIFFESRRTRDEWYLGESQSVNVVAKKFEIPGYLGGLDADYIKASVELGISAFMLSFVESLDDVSEFSDAYYTLGVDRKPQLVLKIESLKGMDFIENASPRMFDRMRLMAARDDLFLSYVNRRAEFLDAVRLIVRKDPEAILASRIMSGLEYPGEVTCADMADLVIARQFGYRHFMLSDGMARCFDGAMQDWREIVLPLLAREWSPEKKRWLKRKK